MHYGIISFYRYCPIDNPHKIQEIIRQRCEELHLLGRILIATEGINGAVCGLTEEIEQFKHFVSQFPFLQGLGYRELESKEQSYHKLVVRVRREIVRFDAKVDLTKSGEYLTSRELDKWYDEKRDFVIVDARNEYEYDVGHFKNAIKMPINTFREFPSAVKILEQYQDKKVVLYCTGGIRCEKASAYLKEQGFPQVFHVQGGIIEYINKSSGKHWQGGLFVFDDRLVNETKTTITSCKICNDICNTYINCHNLDCDELVIMCADCQRKMNSTCSSECKDAPRQRRQMHKHTIVGTVENYFAKNKVAAIKLNCPLAMGQEIAFVGKTTVEFKQKITELRYDINNIISVPVIQKVRKNDVVVVCG